MRRRSADGRRMICAGVLGLAVALLMAREAGAQAICFPPGGGGVPGQPGLPNWWTATAPFDDPRWLGAYGFGHGTVKFNALVEDSGGTKYLVLKWRIKPDPGFAVAGDQIWVGFYNTTTTAATVLQMTRDALVDTTAGTVASGAMGMNAFTRTGPSGFWSSATVPADVSVKARLDTFCGTVAPVVCDEWIMRLRVPTTAAAGGIDLGDTFKAWYEVDVQHGTLGTSDYAKWPNGAVTVDPSVAPLTFPEPATWNDVKVAGPGACAAGIAIQSSDISVANGLGTGTAIDVNTANTFHARPINNTTTVYNPNSIKARLRIADWGSAVGDSPRWITIPDPGCENATGTGPAGTITAGTHFDLTCSWTMTAGQKCAYRPDLSPPGCSPDPGPRYAHQCIMAELSSAAGPIAFSNDSAWNNFNFASASKLDRHARIDIGARGPRDVYVYIAASNMPSKVEPSPPRDSAGEGATGRPGLSPAVRERLKQLPGLVPGRVGAKEAEVLRSLMATGALTGDEVASVMPTYTAYVWHDSGTTVKTATGTVKLLVPQPSFTLFVSHDGPLVGWKRGLTALPGVTITEIARDFYRIGVGGTGMVEVLTSVEAVEQEGGATGSAIRPWLIALILAILLLAFLLARRIIRP